MLANLAKTVNLANRRFWRNFAKVFDEMRRANKLSQVEGPRNVGEFGENGECGENGDSGEISPRSLTK